MILIADSGSTKTDWRLIDDNGKISQYKTAGFNPYFQTAAEIKEELQNVLLPTLANTVVSQVYFYGAGCSAAANCELISGVLQACFIAAIIEVNHDLLAAARALCGHKPGIAVILGTGSNSCYYDGEKIVANNPSLGFILGDEGSGGYLGKKLIQAYLYNELPDDLHTSFKNRFAVTKEEVLENIYKKPMPNRYAASFARFLQHHTRHPYAAKLIYNAFADFFDHHILKYPEHTNVSIHCTGSVAFYFSDIFKAVAADKGCSVGVVMESPIAGLSLYHLGE